MTTSQKTIDQQLHDKVWEVYLYLHQLYRQGDFERDLKPRRSKWPELDDDAEFYDYPAPESDICVNADTITYSEGVEDLYQLVLSLEKRREAWVAEHQVEMLKIKNLIYEVKDYSLAVPAELGTFFHEQARVFHEHVKREEVERHAEMLKQASSIGRNPDYPLARVIKVQIIAALCGVNYLYRSHTPRNHDEALEIVENIEMYVKRELPRQHSNERDSFGLIGLSMYLKGRLLSADGDYEDAQKAYAESSDAYSARLDQKNDFYKRGYITRKEYEEKKAITLRRAAIVSALGVGYLAFVNSRVSKALAALRMSRAALKQNVGAVLGAYTDILFYACKRAEGSSDRRTIEDVIQGIEGCRVTLAKLVPDSHYLHRAGIELAIALHYRAKSEEESSQRAERESDDYAKSMNLLDSAVEFAEIVEEGRFRNQRLLTEALFIRSYIRRHAPGITPENRYSYLKKAEDDARRACSAAKRNKRLECEALIALGSVHYEQAKNNKCSNREADVRKKLDAAEECFRTALERNDRRNVRIEAVCFLKLAKLNLLDPGTVALAHDFFKKWGAIKNRVEHAFCHYIAQQIDKRLSESGPSLIINTEFSWSYPEWEDKLFWHLINTMLIQLSDETRNYQYSESQLHKKIIDALTKRLGFKRTKANDLVKVHKLVEKLKSRNT